MKQFRPRAWSSGWLAHLYALCKGGNDEVAVTAFVSRLRVRWHHIQHPERPCESIYGSKDQNLGAGCMSSYLYKERKGGPTTLSGSVSDSQARRMK